jgi:hypothetical protein
MGRDSEKKYESKQRVRQNFKRVSKPSSFSLGAIIMGAGVLYQMIISKFHKKSDKTPNPTLQVIKGDMQTLVDKIQGANPEWEKYRNFLELARGKK